MEGEGEQLEVADEMCNASAEAARFGENPEGNSQGTTLLALIENYASQIETRIQSWKDAAVEIDASIDEIVNKQQALSNDAEERQEFLKQEQARVMTLVQVFMAKIGVRLP
eukprot:TRINITY_DN8347_c0_g1_i1.p1 TRINITY_DN8347_c0_g1~~TRINITY_DN8347_c0_g1_i1.p1  ORF type:complete len:111 (+),score=21.86 TRINITY_DN8347_c0_g1_i1:62-394(+)